MKTRLLTGLALTSAVILAACSQDRSPAVSLPTEASLAKAPAAPACSFSTANQDARSYFSLRDDPVFARLDAMQTAYRGGAQAATSAGFDVLDRLGAATDAGLVKTTATTALGSKFANDVLLCMSVAGYGNPVDFSLALGAGGVFTVRNGASGLAVTSRASDINGPLYGAEPTGSTWPLGGKTLFYGWPLSVQTLFGDDASGNVFDLRTLPSGLNFNPTIRAGVCVTDVEGARILHKHAGDPAVILPPAGRPNFCPPPPSTALEPAPSSFALAAYTVASWLAPKPAYAARAMMMPAFGGGGGGLVSGLSEIGPVEFTPSLAFQGRVPNAARSDTARALDGDPTTSQFDPIIRVRALSAAGRNPLAGVTITLTVIGNKGSFDASNRTAVTDADGYAAFPDLAINKSGGYTITASAGEFGGTGSVTSNMFNISGQ